MRIGILCVLLGLAGCGGADDDDACTPGESQACTCMDGRMGAQLCQADGTFSMCACTGPSDDAAQADSASGSDAAPAVDASDTDAAPGDRALVPGGPFLMGCHDETDPFTCSPDEIPPRMVDVSPFEIGFTEVTQASYQACIDAMACTMPFSMTFDPVATPNRPVRGVNFDQAQAYCAWQGARLPTEAEWEKAARGTDTRTWPWGETTPTCVFAHFMNCAMEPIDVGTLPSGDSPYGIHDLAGNLWEWTSDWYAADYYATGGTVDPTGPDTGTERSVRGGAFDEASPFVVRVANRHDRMPDSAFIDVGFRCAKSVP